MINRLKNLVSSQNNVAKHGAAYLGSRVGTKVLSFLMLPVWTVFLSPEEYGVIGLVTAYAGVGAPLILLGLPSSIIRQYHDYEDCWSGYVKTITGYVIGVLLLVYLGMWVASHFVDSPVPRLLGPYRDIFFVTLVGSVFTRLTIAGVQAEQKSKQFIIGNFLSYFSGLALSLLLVIYIGYGAKGFLLGMGAGSIIGSGYLVWKRKHSWLVGANEVKIDYLKKALKYGGMLLPAAVAGWGINFAGRLIVEHYHGLGEVGLFSFAGNLAMVMSFVMISLVQAWSPEYFSIRKKGVSKEIEKTSSYIDGFAMKVSLLVLIGVGSMGSPVLSLLIHDKYDEALKMITPLCAGYLFFGLTNLETRSFMYHGRNGVVSIIYVLSAMFVLLGTWLAVPNFAAYGACIASMIVMVLMLGGTIIFNRVNGERILYVRSYIVALIVSCVCIVGDSMIDYIGWSALVYRSIFGMVLLGVVFLYFKYYEAKNSMHEEPAL